MLLPEVAVIVQDIVRLKDALNHCGLLWNDRRANQAAHEVASLSLSGNLVADWCVRPPCGLDRILQIDKRSCPS